MRELLILLVHLLVTFAKLLRPGGVRAVAAESLVLKHQLVISNRARQRTPNLTSIDRFVLGLTTLFVSPRRLPKLGALIKPATLLNFHKALVERKYYLLFSSSPHCGKPGPKGPSAQLIAAIIEMKQRNPRFGYMRIAQGRCAGNGLRTGLVAGVDRSGVTGGRAAALVSTSSIMNSSCSILAASFSDERPNCIRRKRAISSLSFSIQVRS